jgi:hypothetical protein
MSTRKNPLLIASLLEMGINTSSHMEGSRFTNSDAGSGTQMVTESRSRDQLTFDGHPGPQQSSRIASDLQTSDAGTGSQMVTESRLRDQSMSDERPAPQLSSVTSLRLQTSSIGAGSQMVTEFHLRDQSTSDVRPAPQPSLVTISELRISEAGANPHMVTEFRSRDQSTFVGQPASQLSSTTIPNTRPNLSMLRDELLPSSGSDTSQPRAPLEETVRPRTLVRSFETPLSAHVVNAEVVPRLPGPSLPTIPAGGLLEAGPVIPPQFGSIVAEGPSGANPRGGDLPPPFQWSRNLDTSLFQREVVNAPQPDGRHVASRRTTCTVSAATEALVAGEASTEPKRTETVVLRETSRPP